MRPTWLQYCAQVAHVYSTEGSPYVAGLDAESLDFHRGASETYDRLAREEPGRFLRLDASAEPDEIHQQVMRRVGQLL